MVLDGPTFAKINPVECVYRVVIIPKENVVDDKEYADKALRLCFPVFKIIKIERDGNKIIVDHIWKGAKELKNEDGFYKFCLEDCAEVVSVECLAKKIRKLPRYLAYVARKLHNGEDPLSRDEFWNRVNNGSYWEDI